MRKMGVEGGGLGHPFTTSVSWPPRKRNAGWARMDPGGVCGWVKGVHWDRLGAKLQKPSGSSFLEEVRRVRGCWGASVGPRPAQGAESSPRDAPMAPPRIESLRLGKCFIE